jgi:hypothetical protein
MQMPDTQEAGQVVENATQEAQEIANQNQEVDNPEAAQDKAATDELATEADSHENDTQADERKFTQSELDDIIKKRIAKAQAIAERKAAKAYAEKLEQLAVKPQAQQQATSVEGKPKLEQFEKVEDYVEAVADWKLQTHQQNQIRQANEQKVVQIQRQIEEKSQRAYDLAEQNPEFDQEEFDALLTRPDLSGEMAFAIMDSDIAPKLMVYLQKNPVEIDRIAKLSPARQAAEIGKMESKLSVVEKVKPSSAPAPIKPVGNRGGAASGNPAEMTQAQYEAMRAKQGASWARR